MSASLESRHFNYVLQFGVGLEAMMELQLRQYNHSTIMIIITHAVYIIFKGNRWEENK